MVVESGEGLSFVSLIELLTRVEVVEVDVEEVSMPVVRVLVSSRRVSVLELKVGLREFE